MDPSLRIDPASGLARADEPNLPPLRGRDASSHEGSARTGTTTLAIAAPDGVVMATEKRATMGHLIGHKNTQKLFAVDSHLALTTAGLVGDARWESTAKS